ncbi:DUF2442 domain-containing protein [Crenobacter intestini]|uniref:DUF2442 domain-containing protein n=1 Tax=Crenobacter intestini TaxID=2563443 RepID=A0A4T0UIS0_9NEIS|nr:DUF2442 domain-containing protein [Crenobacter intestini]TIC78419.1 DUF2442 domain-containing protein [Crenobacter intestini]
MTQIVSVVREDGIVQIVTKNGATIHYPLVLLPTLLAASTEQFSDYRVCGCRIHWDQIGFSLLFAEASASDELAPAA